MAIKYGFFNAIKDPASGAFDRVYSGDDINTYFRGLIGQNGVFHGVDEECRVSIDNSQFDTYQSGTGIIINVGEGRALVNGHWAYISGGESITLDPPDITERIDKISLRYREQQRDVYICVERSDKPSGADGRGENTKPYPKDRTTGAVLPVGQETVDGKIIFEPDEDGLVEIVLAYVKVPDSATGNLDRTIVITSQIGTGMCPWISHLIQDPNYKDIDNWLASYTEIFRNWLKTQMEEAGLDIHVYKEYAVIPKGYQFPLILKKAKNDTSSKPVATPLWDSDDIVEVFYNGLRLVEEVDWNIGPYNGDGVCLYLPALQGWPGKVLNDNDMVLTFLKKSAVNIPSVDVGGEKY